MTFKKLSEYFEQIENTPKRLEMTEILARLIKEADSKEIDKCLYLSLGVLAPAFNSIQFSLAEKLVVRSLALAFNAKEDEIRLSYGKLGDLGTVVEGFKKKQDTKNSQKSVSSVFEKLKEIALYSGTGSQDKKIQAISNLLKELEPVACKYVIRIVLGTMRLGFSDITVIEAISWFLAGDKSLKGRLEKHYRLHPDVGFMAQKIKEKGLKGLDSIGLEVGVPIISAKCARVDSFEEVLRRLKDKAYAEHKYDGTRVQIHLDREKTIKSNKYEQADLFQNSSESKTFVRTFTRNMEDSTKMFPDLIEVVLKNVKATSVILDGEAVGYSKKTGKFIPFQETIKRKRKHNIKEMTKYIPLTLRIFDVLYLNGKSLIDETMEKRWETLKSIIEENEKIELAYHKKIETVEKLSEEFDKALKLGLEGLVIKDNHAKYQVGNRGYAWIKLKHKDNSELSDTVDAVVLGYYFGTGKRTDFGVGAFLIGVYDDKKDSFKTLSKIGTGLTDEQWIELKNKCDRLKVSKLPKNIDCPKELFCDVWVMPKIVVVIKADNITISPLHTAGYALRFPRLIDYRKDKTPEEATTVSEIKKLFAIQTKI